MVNNWEESVAEHRETIEALADGNGPLSDDMARLLEEAEL